MEKEGEKEKPSLREDDDEAEDGGDVAMDDAAASSSPPPPLSWRWLFFTDAYPCSLLQYVVQACSGCLQAICGGSGRGDRRRPGTDEAGDDPAASDTEGGSKATHDWAGARLLARRRPPPGRPAGPRQGRGGSGGSHN